MALTRKDVMDSVKATEPGGTPLEFAQRVIGAVYPSWADGWDDDDDGLLIHTLEAVGWKRTPSPLWSSIWYAEGAYGFVSRIIVNDSTTFLSTDSKGRDRRLPVAGKTFYALPQRGG